MMNLGTVEKGMTDMNVNEIKASEWVERERARVRLQMLSCELGAWRSPESVTRLYLCRNGNIFQIVKLYEGVDTFPTSPDAVCLSEFKHPNRNLLDEKIEHENYAAPQLETMFLEYCTDDEKMKWAVERGRKENLDRDSVVYFFKYKTGAYARVKKNLELDVINSINWAGIINEIITALKEQE